MKLAGLNPAWFLAFFSSPLFISFQHPIIRMLSVLYRVPQGDATLLMMWKAKQIKALLSDAQQRHKTLSLNLPNIEFSVGYSTLGFTSYHILSTYTDTSKTLHRSRIRRSAFSVIDRGLWPKTGTEYVIQSKARTLRHCSFNAQSISGKCRGNKLANAVKTDWSVVDQRLITF